jgi:hypothetical protein
MLVPFIGHTWTPTPKHSASRREIDDGYGAIRLQKMRRSIIRVLIGVAVILLIPAIAMQFTDEVRWTPFDFLAAAALLISSGLVFVYLSGQTNTSVIRLPSGLPLLLSCLLSGCSLRLEYSELHDDV